MARNSRGDPPTVSHHRDERVCHCALTPRWRPRRPPLQRVSRFVGSFPPPEPHRSPRRLSAGAFHQQPPSRGRRPAHPAAGPRGAGAAAGALRPGRAHDGHHGPHPPALPHAAPRLRERHPVRRARGAGGEDPQRDGGGAEERDGDARGGRGGEAGGGAAGRGGRPRGGAQAQHHRARREHVCGRGARAAMAGRRNSLPLRFVGCCCDALQSATPARTRSDPDPSPRAPTPPPRRARRGRRPSCSWSRASRSAPSSSPTFSAS